MNDLSGGDRLALLDRLRAGGWSTFTRYMPAGLVNALGEKIPASIYLDWIRRKAALVGHEVLPGSEVVIPLRDGSVQVSILARPARELDPDPRFPDDFAAAMDPRPRPRPRDRSPWVVFWIVVGIFAIAAVIVLVTTYGWPPRV